MTLFEINEQLRVLLENLEPDEDGCISDEAMESIAKLNQAKDVKYEGMALKIKEWKVESKALEEEAKRLKNRADAVAKKAERLKEYLAMNLREDEAGKDPKEIKFNTTKVAISFRSSEKTIIEDEDLIPAEFMKETISFEPDKTAIKEAIKNGQAVGGAYLQTNYNIQIK